MMNNLRRKFAETFDIYLYFYGNPWVRRIVVLILMTIILCLLITEFNMVLMPASAILTMIFAGTLMIFLLVDSSFYVLSILMSSLQRRIMLIRRVDPDLRLAIQIAEDHVSTVAVEKRELKSMAKQFESDFGNRRPFPMLARALLLRTIPNFWITVFCFTALSMSIALRASYCGCHQSPYTHSCLEVGGFLSVFVHFMYYHVVIFQSLGDGAHSPLTLFTQIIAIVEACISFFYVIFIFGGLFSTAMYVQSEMTPEKLCGDLYETLKTAGSAKNPITRTES
jgi:hypothetical protein